MNTIRRHHTDYWFTLLVFGLIFFGLIMIYSVSKYYSLDLTDGATDKLYLTRQLIWVVLGFFVWAVFQAIDYRFWLKYSHIMLILTLVLLFLPVILSPFGLVSAGRWVGFGFAKFQPAEIAKLTFLIYLSAWFGSKEEGSAAIKQMFVPFLVVTGLVAMVMLLQKDLGTLSVLVVIAASIFVTAGAHLSQLFSGVGLSAFLLWLAIKIEPYRMERFLTFLNPENNSLSSGYHIRNALIAIGSGGLWGLGFGQSKQKYLYLPEAHTDSIFAIICEELGFIRASFVIVIFVLIAMRGIRIARNAPDLFSRYLAIGITSWIFVQAMINIAAMLSLVPLTGIPLPFVSYGGSSLLILLAAVGILNNVAKHQKT
ncbi:MAG TPA: putative lipid II flippase FtsW [bacterium]|nr:putative lipid II flippase FtsW [bacterium]